MALPVAAAATAAVSGVVKLIGGLFKSKKHYHLYYWDPAESRWKFVMDDIPSRVNPASASLQKNGLVTAVIRNKGDKNPDGTLAPKTPPAGYSAAKASGLNVWILAGIACAVALGAFLLKKRRRG